MTGTRTQEKIHQLHNLAGSPDRQFERALDFIKNDRNTEVLLASIRVISGFDIGESRRALLRQFERCQKSNGRSDPGGLIRIAVIDALRSELIVDDIELLTSATLTYEYRPAESAGQLRATGLVALHDIDPMLAGYHAARMLVDPATSRMSGEPALTAVHVLAAGGNELPLYSYVFSDEGTISEVTAESLRNLVTLPIPLVQPIIDRYIGSKDQIILLGLFDLLFNLPVGDEFLDLIINFLSETLLLEIFHFVVSNLVAQGDESTLEDLQTMANFEPNRDKEEILRRALEVR